MTHVLVITLRFIQTHDHTQIVFLILSSKEELLLFSMENAAL